MKKVAVIQFPGTNSEYETVRALQDAGMDAEFFRWNQPADALAHYDGFVVAGGFSYEDRGRSGLIASKDPILQALKAQAALGKPVLGICNGAQILVESGLIPGETDLKLTMALARNKRVRQGKLLGTGFYNENVYLKSTAPQGRTAFTLDFSPNEIHRAPAAHGEGRFTSQIPNFLHELQSRDQIVFRYASETGEISPDFPINPNGALDNAAAICNPRGNVMAIMPHPERAPAAPMPKIFTSMRKYMEGTPLAGSYPELKSDWQAPATEIYAHKPNTIEIWVKLIITDNEAQTLQSALGWQQIPAQLQRFTHYEIEHEPMSPGDQLDLAHALVNSGELLNTHKEQFIFVLDNMSFPQAKPGANYILSRDLEDSVGPSKQSRLSYDETFKPVKVIRHGIAWEVIADSVLESILETRMFGNLHAQNLFKVQL